MGLRSWSEKKSKVGAFCVERFGILDNGQHAIKKLARIGEMQPCVWIRKEEAIDGRSCTLIVCVSKIHALATGAKGKLQIPFIT